VKRAQILDAATAAVGAIAALVLAVVVTRVSSAYLDDQPWFGGLFVLGALLLTIVGLDLWSPVRRAGMWRMGAVGWLVAVVGYAASAVAGLPDASDSQGWWDPWLRAGAVAAAVYLMAWGVAVSAGQSTASARPRPHRLSRHSASSRSATT
jgi:hypothetical protein